MGRFRRRLSPNGGIGPEKTSVCGGPSIRIGLLTLLCALPLSPRPASAQQPPPIQGVTGTIATEGTIDAEHKAAHTIAEGAAYVVDSVKKILPGGKGTRQNPLDDFAEGSRVILRDVAKVDGESPTTTARTRT